MCSRGIYKRSAAGLSRSCVMILPEYLQTIFISKKPLEGGWPEKFSVITPCNPMSRGERQEDAVAMTRLRKHLSRRGLKRHKVTGASPDWSSMVSPHLEHFC
jgi:hypothetical protein